MARRAFSLLDIQERAFNRPVMITREKAEIVLGVIGPRLNVGSLVIDGENEARSIGALSSLAAKAAAEMEPMPGDRSIAARDWDTGAIVDPYENWRGLAIIPARGTLMAENGLNPYSGATGYDGLSYKLRYAGADAKVGGVVLDLDTPGGEVVDLMELCAEIVALRSVKPVRAIIRGCAASAGYALAAAANEITAAPYSIVGSIGCLMMHADWSKALEKEGVAVTLITSAAHKADGSQLFPLAADVRERLQMSVDESASTFIDHVAAARSMDREAIVAQEARFYSGDDVLKHGLVDKFMSRQDSLTEFAEQVNGSGISGRAARSAPGARSQKGMTMDNGNAAPAGDQPVHTEAALASAVATAQTQASTAATTAERERITALIELDAESSVSDGAMKAITDGTDAGAFAIGLAKAAKVEGAAALAAAKADAVTTEQIPPKGDARGAGTEEQVNRGAAAVDRLRGKVRGLPARA